MFKANKNETISEKIYLLINDMLLLFAFLVVIYPLLYVLSSSFSSISAVAAGRVTIFPVDFSLVGYNALFANNDIISGYINTIFYATVGTAFNLIMTIIAAYPLSRKDLKAKNYIMFMFSFTMLFSGGLIPSYLLISGLGWIDKRIVMIIPGALSVWLVIITRTFFQSTIPQELLEASQLDGCSDFKFMTKIVVPLSKPIIGVLSLYYAVGHWNSFMHPFIYLQRRELFPLQIILREILVLSQVKAESIFQTAQNAEAELARVGLTELLKYSTIVVSTFPILCLYPFVQKYFVKGIMLGSLKG